jgi:phosphopantetheinyl transferase
MPLFHQININEDCTLYLWKIEEEVEDLHDMVNLPESDQDRVQGFGSISRKKEFLSTRILVQNALGKDVFITNDEHGKPFLVNSNLNISITHTKSFAGIILSYHHATALDMEYLSDRVHRITKRFLSPEELSNISKEKGVLHLYQHWCAKECLIKLYGKKDVHLTDELKIDSFSPTDESFSGSVCRKDFNHHYTFHHLQFDQFVLVYSVKKLS